MTEGHLTVALLLFMILIGLLVLPEDSGSQSSLPDIPDHPTPSLSAPQGMEVPRIAPAPPKRTQPTWDSGRVVRLISVSW